MERLLTGLALGRIEVFRDRTAVLEQRAEAALRRSPICRGAHGRLPFLARGIRTAAVLPDGPREGAVGKQQPIAASIDAPDEQAVQAPLERHVGHQASIR